MNHKETGRQVLVCYVERGQLVARWIDPEWAKERTVNTNTMTRIVNGARYSTETATLLASDVYWDGHNYERAGRNRWLYRTPKGRYFLATRSLWQGEQDTLEPLGEVDARRLYEGALRVHEVDYETAFPGAEVVDA